MLHSHKEKNCVAGDSPFEPEATVLFASAGIGVSFRATSLLENR